MTYWGQLVARAPLLPGRLLPSGAGGRGHSGGTPGRWLQWFVLMALSTGSPSRQEQGQGGAVGHISPCLTNTRHEKEHPSLPDFWSPLSREREFTTLSVTKKPQSAHPTSSKPATLLSSLCRLLKSWVINRQAEPFVTPPPNVSKEYTVFTLCTFKFKACHSPPMKKVMHWRRKRLIDFKSPLKTRHCCSVSSITNPQQSTDLAINPVQGFSHTNLLNHSLCAAVIYTTRWGRNHSLPMSLLCFALSHITVSMFCMVFSAMAIGKGRVVLGTRSLGV